MIRRLMFRLAMVCEEISILEDAECQPIYTQDEFNEAAALSARIVKLKRTRRQLIKVIERLRVEVKP